MRGIRFTRHALEKFKLLESYGFSVEREFVLSAIEDPVRVDTRRGQFLALKNIDETHALRVVYEERNGIKLVITFYPVRRARFGV